MKQILSLLAIISFLLYSCDGNDKKAEPIATNEVAQPVNDSSLHEDEIEFDQSIDSNISSIIEKMKRKNQLFEKDYYIISEFLLNNKDESLAEEVGYALFAYLKGSRSRNSEFLSALSKKGSAYGDSVLVSLVEIMCIDLGEDKYTYEHAIEDFSLFKNNEAVRRAFKSCMDNKVE